MSAELLTTMSVAFLSSFSHCYAMCGGLNLAFLRLNSSAKSPFLLTLSYHLSRIFAYVLLGVIFGAFGNIFAFVNKNLFFFVLGVFMVLLGIALLFRGKILALFENPFFFNLFAKKIWQKAHFKGYKSAVALGFCNAFVPCGLVYFALALAMSQNTLFQSAFIMLVFGLCTLPALLFFNQVLRFLGQSWQRVWARLSAFIIALYGLYLMYLGVMR